LFCEEILACNSWSNGVLRIEVGTNVEKARVNKRNANAMTANECKRLRQFLFQKIISVPLMSIIYGLIQFHKHILAFQCAK